MRSTIRNASRDDLPAIRELAHAEIDEAALTTIPGEQYMLVLDDDDGQLAAAAHLTIAHRTGQLRFLAVAKRHEGTDLERRMHDVIDSICEAFGAAHGLQRHRWYGNSQTA